MHSATAAADVDVRRPLRSCSLRRAMPSALGRAGLRTRARPDDQLGRDGRPRRRSGTVVQRQQALDAAAADLGEVLTDGGQGYVEELRLGDVVETHDADVVRNPAA